MRRNPSSDETRDLANKILDVNTNYEYSKFSLSDLESIPGRFIDSLISKTVVPVDNKTELITEMVNMAIYRRRNYAPLELEFPQIRNLAIDLINELKKEYHLR